MRELAMISRIIERLIKMQIESGFALRWREQRMSFQCENFTRLIQIISTLKSNRRSSFNTTAQH